MVTKLLKNVGIKTLKTTVGVVKKGTKIVGSKEFKIIYGTYCVATTVVCTVQTVKLLKHFYGKGDKSNQNVEEACDVTNKKDK